MTVLLLLVRNDELFARGGLVLIADEVRDGLVLGLLGGRLVALVALAEEFLLDEVDGWGEEMKLAFWVVQLG